MPTNRFVGTVSNLWSEGANWSLGIAPNSTTMPITPTASSTGLISPTATSTGVISPTATLAASSPIINFSSPPASLDPARLTPGVRIFGPGIPLGATVLSVSGNTITMGVNATGTTSGVTIAVGSTALSFPSTPTAIDPARLIVGARIFGTGIPPGVTVSSISGTTITFSGTGTTQSPLINGSTVAVGSTSLAFSSSPTTADPALLTGGVVLSGAGVPTGATIVSILGNTISFSGAGTTQLPVINGSTVSVASGLQDVIFGATSPDCFYDYTRAFVAPNPGAVSGNAGFLFSTQHTTATVLLSLDMSSYASTLTFNADSIAAVPGGDPAVPGVAPISLVVRNSISFGPGATITSVPINFSPSGIYPDSNWIWGDYLTSWYTIILGATGTTCSITTNGATVSVSLFTAVTSMTLSLNDDLTITRSIQALGSSTSLLTVKSNVPGQVRRINIPSGVKGQSTWTRIFTQNKQLANSPGPTQSVVVAREFWGKGPHYFDYVNLQDIHASGQTITTYNSVLSNCYNTVNFNTTGEAPFGKSSLNS